MQGLAVAQFVTLGSTVMKNTCTCCCLLPSCFIIFYFFNNLVDLTLRLLLKPGGKKGGANKGQQRALQSMLLVKAGCDVYTSLAAKEIQNATAIRRSYDLAAKHLVENPYELYGDKSPPPWFKIELFTSIDVDLKKPRPPDDRANLALWKAFQTSKREVTNRDNVAVDKAIAKMPSGRVPSGKTVETSFWPEVVSTLFSAWHAEGHVEDPGMGGSDSKATHEEEGEGDEAGGEAIDEEISHGDEEYDGVTAGAAGAGAASVHVGHPLHISASGGEQWQPVLQGLTEGNQKREAKGKGNGGGAAVVVPPNWVPVNILAITFYGILSIEIQAPIDRATGSKAASGSTDNDELAGQKREQGQSRATLRQAVLTTASAEKLQRESTGSSSSLPTAMGSMEGGKKVDPKLVIADAVNRMAKAREDENALTAKALEAEGSKRRDDYALTAKALEAEGSKRRKVERIENLKERLHVNVQLIEVASKAELDGLKSKRNGLLRQLEAALEED